MATNIIAVFIIFLFVLLTVVGVWAFIRVRKMGLLSGFMKGKWLLSILTTLFMVSFIVNSIALLIQTEWAMPAMRYTIYGWLIYLWLYGLKKLFDLIALLKWETATSISQFKGRSKFFDELLEKSIELSRESAFPEREIEEGEVVSEKSWEELVDDEEWFKETFPGAIRKKIRSKVTGLLVLTAIFGVMLVFLR